MAKIGQLVLNGGRWESKQIVPADWLDQSFQTRAKVADLYYGYHWWLGPQPTNGPRWVAGFGNGGQRLFVMPQFDLLVVIVAGNYNQPDAWKVLLLVRVKSAMD